MASVFLFQAFLGMTVHLTLDRPNLPPLYRQVSSRLWQAARSNLLKNSRLWQLLISGYTQAFTVCPAQALQSAKLRSIADAMLSLPGPLHVGELGETGQV